VRQTPLLDKLTSLTDLLAADVDRRDLAAVTLSDPYRRRTEAAADIEDLLPPPRACHLSDQIGVRVERLRQRLGSRAEIAEMEAVP
jgi:hypothetical protein